MNGRKRDPELDPELAEELGRWAESERAAVEGARDEATDEDRRRARATFAELAERPRGRGRLPRAWLSAAAVAMAVALGWLLLRDDAADDDGRRGGTMMGPSAEGGLLPSGEVGFYDRFAWSGSEAGSPRYALRVFNGDAVQPALSKDDLAVPAYEPTPEERALLGPTIHWEVYRLDPSGGPPTLLGSASASLRGR